MKLKTKVLKRLRKSLPPGVGPVLRARLLKAEHDFSAGYIYRVLSPDKDDYNELIIDEAIAYLEEIRKIQLKKEEKILAITE